MKIISATTKEQFDVDLPLQGENSIKCPVCSKDRKKKTLKPFHFNREKGSGYCHHCNTTFLEYKPEREKKEYVAPEWKNKTALRDQTVGYFSGRMISQTTLNHFDVSESVQYMPQVEENVSVMCFPYYMGDKLVNIKYRGKGKIFKLYPGAELIFYNINSITGSDCVIVEGEIDAMSFHEAGITNVISVPNGAGKRTSMDYLDNYIDRFENVTKFYIGVDNDLPGIDLRDELIRRIGQERCLIINYKDCKDANEYLVKYGSFELSRLINDAKDVPVGDIVYVNDIYDDVYNMYLNGCESGLKSGIDELDSIVTWELSRLCTITGIPSHGKGVFLDNLMIRLNMKHGWKAAIFSPENYPLKYHVDKIASKITAKRINSKYMNKREFEQVMDYIQDNFFWIHPEEDITIEKIISRAKFLVKRHGIKMLIIDPYNKLEHTKNHNESETEYISRFIDKLIVFSKMHNCLVFLVAHPKKMELEKDQNQIISKKFRVPNLYDISGSANFFNKTDYGITVYRNYGEFPEDRNMDIHVQKIKFKHLGDGGMVSFAYNYINERLEVAGSDKDYWKNDNWLSVQQEQDALF